MRIHNQARILEAFAGKKILVVGDVMLDIYLWGDVRRISPEAPVPVVEMRRRSHICGGAGNVAANVAALGGKVSLAGVIGDDADGLKLRESLQSLGIEPAGLVEAAGRPTTTKLRVVAHNQQIARVDSESRSPLDAPVEARLIAGIEKALPAADACIVSDYGKGVVSANVTEGLIRGAREAGKPVVVDPKGVDFAKYKGATVITPNVKEAAEATGWQIESTQELEGAGRELITLLAGSAVLVTRGEKGMALLQGTDGLLEIPAMAKTVYDVTGAGDTVVGALAMALASGATLEQAAEIANAAAGIVVGKLGTATVSVSEILAISDAEP